MLISIGDEVEYKREIYHVQDTDAINRAAFIGKVDENGLVWDRFWVSQDELLRTD